MSEEWGPWRDGNVFPRLGAWVQVRAVPAGMPDAAAFTHEGRVIRLCRVGYYLDPTTSSPKGVAVLCWRERRPPGLIQLEHIARGVASSRTHDKEHAET